jgi:hypothetical protein
MHEVKFPSTRGGLHPTNPSYSSNTFLLPYIRNRTRWYPRSSDEMENLKRHHPHNRRPACHTAATCGVHSPSDMPVMRPSDLSGPNSIGTIVAGSQSSLGSWILARESGSRIYLTSEMPRGTAKTL